MDVTEGVDNEHVDVSGSEEQIADEAQDDLTEIALAVDEERDDLRGDHDPHGDDNHNRDCIALACIGFSSDDTLEIIEEVEISEHDEEEHDQPEYDRDHRDLAVGQLEVHRERDQ